MGSIIRRVAVALSIVVAAVLLWYRRIETTNPSRVGHQEVQVVARGVVARPRDVVPTPGWQAVTVPFDPVTSVASLIMPGSRIDILAVPHGTERTRMVAENVRVLAVGSTRTRNGMPTRASSLTVEVPLPADVERLISGVASADLRYLLRGDDGAGVATVRVGPTSPVPNVTLGPPCTNRRAGTLVYDAVLLSCAPQAQVFRADSARAGRDR